MSKSKKEDIEIMAYIIIILIFLLVVIGLSFLVHLSLSRETYKDCQKYERLYKDAFAEKEESKKQNENLIAENEELTIRLDELTDKYNALVRDYNSIAMVKLESEE